MSYVPTTTHRFQVSVEYVQLGPFILPELLAHVLRQKRDFTQHYDRALISRARKVQTSRQPFLAHLGRFVVLFLEVGHLSPPG